MRAHLKPSEKLILQSQKHWIVLLNPALVLLLFYIITVTAFYFNSIAGFVFLSFTCIPLVYLIWKILSGSTIYGW